MQISFASEPQEFQASLEIFSHFLSFKLLKMHSSGAFEQEKGAVTDTKD